MAFPGGQSEQEDWLRKEAYLYGSRVTHLVMVEEELAREWRPCCDSRIFRVEWLSSEDSEMRWMGDRKLTFIVLDPQV